MTNYINKHYIKKTAFIVILVLLPVLAIFISLFIGRYGVGWQEVIDCLKTGMGINAGVCSDEALAVVLQLRLPRALAAAMVGAGLAASGGAFQGVFRNPLVNSGLLGVSNGAGFGAALAIIFFGGAFSVYPLAFGFGIIAVALSYWVARIYKTVPTVMLILGGTIVSALFSALLALLKYLADPADELPTIVYWLMGSVSAVGYDDFWAFLPILLGIVILLVYSWRINVLSMGDKEALSLGVNVKSCKLVIIVAATLSTAGAVCISGVVGWIGLIVPHIGRMIIGNDNRKLLPVSISVGAVFLVVVDTISRSISSSEVPLGILTAIIGAPFFVFLLKKTKGGGWQ
ncbi:MAG: FecCD family ABC transporter permease [Bacillota bacterium]|jgi:iron complex transport system permease protein